MRIRARSDSGEGKDHTQTSIKLWKRALTKDAPVTPALAYMVGLAIVLHAVKRCREVGGGGFLPSESIPKQIYQKNYF